MLYEHLKELRESTGLTQEEFGKSVGVAKSTYNNYETGTRDPKSDFWIAVATKYGVTIDYLMGYSDNPHKTGPTGNATKNKAHTSEPYTVEVEATKYKRLDRHGKQVVCAVIAEEEKRIASEYQWQEPKAVYPLSDYLQTASAGYGDFNDDASYTVVDLVKRPPMGASFLITINGDSMEPTYHDGDKLFIKAQETLNIGEVGLFAVGSDLYIKEYGADGLISHNPKYPIKRPEMDTIVKVYGKVLGVCTDDYFGK